MEIQFAGHRLVLDPSGAVFWPAINTLLVCGLHLERPGLWARLGFARPRYITKATLSKLSLAIAHYHPARVVCIMDGAHEMDDFRQLDGGDKDVLLYTVNSQREWHWVLGPHRAEEAAILSGAAHETLLLEGVLVTPEKTASASPQIVGRLEPKLLATIDGRRMSGPAFVHDETLLIMPAFGCPTGTLDARSHAIASLLESPSHYLASNDRIWKL